MPLVLLVEEDGEKPAIGKSVPLPELDAMMSGR
jgi:hypothetical protein